VSSSLDGEAGLLPRTSTPLSARAELGRQDLGGSFWVGEEGWYSRMRDHIRGPEKVEGERGHSLRGHSTSKGSSWTGCRGMSCGAKEGQLGAGMGRARREGERSARAPQVPKDKVSGHMSSSRWEQGHHEPTIPVDREKRILPPV